ncbi:hypothetical protein [Chitinophaga eiseniae]|uniref:Uncharacterized protein n=1 Tax=Chitinophaga eiseniae TaxID=634771 RepID=A0A847SJW9_9BACT|nr:hypothetical protein [Chitinophaga eiseniae]NLR77768.1 hypothetical protein [Chitinophaga eiseniae]
MLKRITCLLLLAMGLSNVLYSQTWGNLDLIPRPARIMAIAGTFTFTPQGKVYSTPRFKEVAALLAGTTGPLGAISPWKNYIVTNRCAGYNRTISYFNGYT